MHNQTQTSGTDEKTCPFCGEPILATAIRCKQCGANLNGAQTRRKLTIIFALVALICVAMYCLYTFKKNDDSNEKFLEGLNGSNDQVKTESRSDQSPTATATKEQITPQQTDEFVQSVGRTLVIKQRVSAAIRHADDLDARGLHTEAARVRTEARAAWEAEKGRIARDDAKFKSQGVVP